MMGGTFGRQGGDKPYVRILDYEVFTKALVASGYRPHTVTWKSGNVDEVWMKDGQGLGFERDGANVVPRVMEDGLLVDEAPVILVDPLDGGYINEYGRVVGIQAAA